MPIHDSSEAPARADGYRLPPGARSCAPHSEPPARRRTAGERSRTMPRKRTNARNQAAAQAKTTTAKTNAKAAAAKKPAPAAAKPNHNVIVEAKPGPTSDEIAREAYYIWLERGGSEIENWLEAESRLRAVAR